MDRITSYLKKKQSVVNKTIAMKNKNANLSKINNSSLIQLSDNKNNNANNLNLLNSNNKLNTNTPQLIPLHQNNLSPNQRRKYYNNYQEIMKNKKIESEISKVEQKIDKKSDNSNFDLHRETDAINMLKNLKGDENKSPIININIINNLNYSDSMKSRSISSKGDADTQKEDSFIQNISIDNNFNFKELTVENNETLKTDNKQLTDDVLNATQSAKTQEKKKFIAKEKSKKTMNNCTIIYIVFGGAIAAIVIFFLIIKFAL